MTLGERLRAISFISKEFPYSGCGRHCYLYWPVAPRCASTPEASIALRSDAAGLIAPTVPFLRHSQETAVLAAQVNETLIRGQKICAFSYTTKMKLKKGLYVHVFLIVSLLMDLSFGCFFHLFVLKHTLSSLPMWKLVMHFFSWWPVEMHLAVGEVKKRNKTFSWYHRRVVTNTTSISSAASGPAPECAHIACGWPLCPDGAIPETKPGDCCPSCPGEIRISNN